MKQISVLLAAVFLCSLQQGDSQQTKHVVFVSIDGFRPDFYLDSSWHTPNLRMLMKGGAYAKGVNSVFPSMTYPSHTTIVTGVQPDKHGVYYNGMFEPQGAGGKSYWHDSSIHVPTLWTLARKKGMTTAALFWPVSAEAPVDYNIPDIGGMGEAVREKYSLPQDFIPVLKKEVFGGAAKIEYGKNQEVAKIAAYIIKKSQPAFMALHVFSVDHEAHGQGRDGEKVREAVADADEAVGIIIEALKAAGIWEQTTLMIGGDHGFYNVTRSIAPNVLLKDAGLMNNPKEGDWKAQFNSVGGSSYLYLKDRNDKETLGKIKQMLAAQPDSIKKLYRIINPEQLRKIGANPEVALALSAENDASFNNASAGLLVKPGKGGAHGHYPDTKNIRTGFIAYGAGIKKGTVINEMSLRDIAPMIAQLLNLPLENAEGKIPQGILGK